MRVLLQDSGSLRGEGKESKKTIRDVKEVKGNETYKIPGSHGNKLQLQSNNKT